MKFFPLSLCSRLIIGAVAAMASGDSVEAQFKAEFVTFTGGRPVALTSPVGDTERLFVVDKFGRIRIIKNGSVMNPPFLDWGANIAINGENGLLGLAFHPDYANNGYFYISYTDASPFGNSVVSRLSVDPNNPNLADPTSELIMFGPVPQTAVAHKAGDLHFGLDGFLYYSLGDGTDGGTLEPMAQDLLDPRGSILRFDVDGTPPYAAPGNPFIGDPNGLDVIFAYGLRNPFRFGIDSLTGDIFIGDVGAGEIEEIDHIPAGTNGGQNLGWPCLEGNAPTAFSACNPNPVAPLLTYTHSSFLGCSVIGGKVYRGTDIPSLYGKYVYTDFCTSRYWAMDFDGQTVTNTEITSLVSANGDNSSAVAVCTGGDGELYFLNHFSSRLFKVVPDCEVPVNVCESLPNSAGPGATMDFTGTTSVANNDLTLIADGAVPIKPGLFIYGLGPLSSIPLGNGVLCMPPPIFRIQPLAVTDAAGVATLSFDNTDPVPPFFNIQPGTSVFFQYWFRDTGVGAGFNLTDALFVNFCE